ncbi:MAG: hypothetical protein EOP84_02095 [Verrucomicrobiaceae bacterium]|nr:MAG: hypothetical protein EOP84_02095 [Verrucomicrobiaceae bacterium]
MKYHATMLFMVSCLLLFTPVSLGDGLPDSKTMEILNLYLPKDTAAKSEKDSELVVYSAATGLVTRAVLDRDKGKVEVTDKNSYLLELESRDEESWDVSVLGAWKIDTVTKPALESCDVRKYAKAELTIGGIPQEASFGSFYLVDGTGLRDFICFYQAVVDHSVNDNLFSIGCWIFVPMNESGDPVLTPRIVHVSNIKNTYQFNELPQISEALADALKRMRLFKPKNPAQPDPFAE